MEVLLHRWDRSIALGRAAANSRRRPHVAHWVRDRKPAPFVDALVARFEGRVDDTAGFAMRNRVVLLRASNGTPIDVALGALPFEEHAIERATPFAIGDGNSIVTCSAGDLVVHKVFAGRGRDWLDVEGVLVRQTAALDWSLILAELRPLLELKEDHQAEARLIALRDRLGRS